MKTELLKSGIIFAREKFAPSVFAVQLIYEINIHVHKHAHIHIHITYKTNVFANEILSLDI